MENNQIKVKLFYLAVINLENCFNVDNNIKFPGETNLI